MILIDDQTARCPVDADAILRGVRAALDHGEAAAAEIRIAIVDDDALHAINRDHLGHDWPTDVCTFPYDNPDGIEGDIVVSLDMAARVAAEEGRDPGEELLLYVVHGTLHLCGWDDIEPNDRAAMRQAERDVLAALGIAAPTFE